MNELIEGVLAVGARLSPNNGAGGVLNSPPVSGHILAIGFHVTLLEVGCEAVHVL